MYYVNPSTWWIGGILSAVLTHIPVQCKPGEATAFPSPPGQTCGEYAADFLRSSGAGYIIDPQATGSCGYCPYSSGEEYLRTINIGRGQLLGDKWRDFGVFLVFVFTNWMLVYFFIYTVRVRGWSFGMGPLFGVLGKGVDAVKGLFAGKAKKGDEEKREA